MSLILREPSITLGLAAQALYKENEAPCGNSSEDTIKACSPQVDKTSKPPCGNSSEDALIKACSPQVDKTSRASCGNGSVEAIKASSPPVNRSAHTSHEAANEYAGNTWEKYFMTSVEEPVVRLRESPSGAGEHLGHAEAGARQSLGHDGKPLRHVGAGEPLGCDKYSAIALLDDDQDDEKWSERTAVITALDHQVRKIMKQNQIIIMVIFL